MLLLPCNMGLNERQRQAFSTAPLSLISEIFTETLRPVPCSAPVDSRCKAAPLAFPPYAVKIWPGMLTKTRMGNILDCELSSIDRTQLLFLTGSGYGSEKTISFRAEPAGRL